MSHNIDQAKHFLTLLDEGEEQFTFQTFDDKPGKNPVLAKWLHGTIDEHFETLVNYNKAGAGVFVMAQHGDGSGRNIKAVDRIRCVFNENDNGVTKEYPLEPHIIVETSPGKQHHYFLCDGIKVDDFKSIQGRLIADYGSDPAANDLPRVLRLPGFFHNKREPHMVRIVHESGGQVYSRDRIIQAYPPYIREVERKKEDIKVDEKLVLELRSALNGYRPDEYKTWIDTGLALKALGDVGLGLWFDWSSGYAAFDRQEAYDKWDSFKPDNIGYKSVFFMAQEAGWVNVAKKPTETTIKERESIDEVVEFELVPIRQIIENPINITWTIKNVIERGGVNLISGAYGSGKSFLAYSMAFCVSAGLDWYGHKTGQCPVIILAGEGHSGIGDRFNALSIHHEIDCPDDLYLSKSPARISDRTNALWVKKAVDAICPESGFIIIDTLNRNFGDGDENSTKDMTAFITSIDDHFRSTGKTILIVHHTGHAEAGRARGSSVLPGSCEGEFIVSNSDGIVKFSCKKQKNSKRPDDFEFSFKEIFLNRYDDDYEPVFSLVLEHDGSQDSDTKTLGKNDIIFLNTMKEYALGFGVTMPKYLFLDDQENYPNVTVLEERNFKKVTFENFKCSPGSAKMTYKRCKEKLVRLGFINEIGGYIYPLKSHN